MNLDPYPVGSGKWWAVVAGLVVFLSSPLWGSFIYRWYQCQQLAPIDRLFTRGC